MNKKIISRIVSVLLVALLILLLLNGFSIRSIFQQFYSANVHKTELYSNSLKKEQDVNIYLPPNYSEDHEYPVLYLLHGKDGNEDSWFNGLFGISAAHIDQTANQLIKEGKIKPLIIVSPMIDNSYGVDSATNTKHVDDHDEGLYAQFIIKDLIPYIDSKYSTINDKSGRYIGGLSMGGFAALHLAFTNDDLFSKVGGHSAALRLDVNDGSGINWLFSDSRSRNQIDPLYIADTMDNSKVSIYLDHGDMDHNWLIEGNKTLYNKLKTKGFDVQYHSNPGKHDYKYWSNQTENYLMFYAKVER